MTRGRRILILLLVLLLVAGMTFFERQWVRSPSRTLNVAIYPVAMDAAGAAYLDRLEAGDFQEISGFLAREAQRRKKSRADASVTLKPPLRRPPPPPQGRGMLDTLQFTLGLRWYAFRHTPFWASLGTLRIFVLYHEYKEDQALPHSLGLQKGLIGVVHVFASDAQRAQNNVVITHELLHTLGAKDKYDQSNLPLYPIGYADPDLEPRYPQHRAEIMAGRIPINASRAEIPRSLDETMIGYVTAYEIGW